MPKRFQIWSFFAYISGLADSFLILYFYSSNWVKAEVHNLVTIIITPKLTTFKPNQRVIS
jgi:hypothetical protein